MEDGRRWAIETFGGCGVDLRFAVPRVVHEEHNACVDAQEASGHRNTGVYGQFWRGILERFEAFGNLSGAALIRPGRAPYTFPVINGVALFPWRFGHRRDADFGTTPFATSDARDAMFSLPPVNAQLQFDLGVQRPELTEDERELAAIVEASMADRHVTTQQLVVVAISSSVSGLHHLSWGDVVLNGDGCIGWGGFHESLSDLKVEETFALAEAAKTFTSGEPPAKQIGLRALDTKAAAFGERGDA